eukprot:scaffold2632_cov158-Amphora_coffeaeformis.AAC.10
MKRIYVPRRDNRHWNVQNILVASIAFLFGCVLTASIVLNVKVNSVDPQQQHRLHPTSMVADELKTYAAKPDISQSTKDVTKKEDSSSLDNLMSPARVLQGVKILVVIVAFDFSQIPHLEEVIDGYHDVCSAGAQKVDLIIHTTVPYPITLVDLWNTRFNCENFSLTIVIKPKVLRLHLVDCHRETFYSKIDEYDLFIYTEDDIRVRPTTVATYLVETEKVKRAVAGHPKYKFSDFNVGIVRYEYDYPSNVIIDDNTRHATQNVTRVYWEHSSFQRPVMNNAIKKVKQDPLANDYITMSNHHQGMFLATQDLLLAWKERCNFHIASNRPGNGPQPTEGTQRVWMSSQMLYGGRHCNVQQVLPKDTFPTLTVLHLPNKNYRRVGKYRNRKFADGSEVFEQPHPSLLRAMEAHLGLRLAMPNKPQIPYRGVQMVDDVARQHDRFPLLDQRMKEFNDYVKRGGVLSEEDMTKVDLLPEGTADNNK